jgi:hypothetical protein
VADAPSIASAVVVIAVTADEDMVAAGMLVMHPGVGRPVAASALRVTLRARRAHGDAVGSEHGELGAAQIVTDRTDDRGARGGPTIAALTQVEQPIDGELPQLADLDGRAGGDAGPSAQVATLFAAARALTGAPGPDDGPTIVACELSVCRAPRRASLRYRVVRRPGGGAS